MRRPTGTVVVTGASTRIGRACALYLASEEGFAVVGTVRGAEDGERLVADSGGRVAAVAMDVTDPASIEAAASEVVGLVGDRGLHGLVNNTAVGVPELLAGTSREAIRRQFDVVSGLRATAESFLPLLRRARGRIVNVGPMFAGNLPFAMAVPYGNYTRSVWELDDALRDELELHVASVRADFYDVQVFGDVEAPLPDAPRARLEAAVTRAVAHALTARKPRVRYVVSRFRPLDRVLLRVLPWRWRLRLMRRDLSR